MFSLDCPVVLTFDDRIIVAHNVLKDVFKLDAPFIVVASSFVRTLDIYLGSERLGTLGGASFSIDQVPSELFWVFTQLYDDTRVVSDQPLIDNLIVQANAVGDASDREFSASRFAEIPVTEVSREAENSVRRHEPSFVVSRPNDVFASQFAIGELRLGCESA